MNAPLRQPLPARILLAFRRRGEWIELTRNDLFTRMNAKTTQAQAEISAALLDMASRGIVRAEKPDAITIWAVTPDFKAKAAQ